MFKNEGRKESLFARIIRNLRRLHTLDIVFLVFVVAILGVFLYFRISKQTVWIPITVKVAPEDMWWEEGAAPWMAQNLKPGAIGYNTFGEKVAEIKSVQDIDTQDAKRLVYVRINLKVTFDKKQKTYSYNYQPLLVGNGISLPFGSQSVHGVITYIGDEKPVVLKSVELKVMYVFPWVASAFSKGLTATDAEGRLVTRIDDMSVSDAQNYELTDTQGRVIMLPGTDSTRRDVSITATIAAKEYAGMYYTIDGSPLKIGNPLHLEFPSVTAQYAEIVRIIN